MAPMAFVNREQLLELLRDPRAEGGLWVSLGRHHPTAVVRNEADGWYLRMLEIDRVAADAAREKAMAEGGPWMPEHEDEFKKAGRVVLQAASALELADQIETMDWTFDPNGLEPRWFAQFKEQRLSRGRSS